MLLKHNYFIGTLKVLSIFEKLFENFIWISAFSLLITHNMQQRW